MTEIRFTTRRPENEHVRPEPPRSPLPGPRFAIRGAETNQPAPRRRNAWRQRMIDAERGLRLTLRMDATMFVHLFAATCILAAGFVLALSALQWAIVTLAITVVLSAETFNQLLRTLSSEAGHHLPGGMRNVVQIGAAALLITSIGAGTTIILVFVNRLQGG
jgi:diacylglycerol kinase